MANFERALYNIRIMDDLSKQKSIIHKLHPLAKLIVVFAYLITVVSFDRYDITGLLPLILYPIIIFSLGDIPFTVILKRLLIVEPLIIGIGILNPFFDKELILLGSVFISRGWITFADIMIKSSLAVFAALLLIATTGMNDLGYAMRKLRIPKIFVTQLLLTHRYIDLFISTTGKIVRAYNLRTKSNKGIKLSDIGSLTGQLLLRTMDKAERVYQAMLLRGFNGEYFTSRKCRFRLNEIIFISIWISFFIIIKNFNIPETIGIIFTGR